VTRKHLARRRKTKAAIQKLEVLKKKDLSSSDVQMGLNLILIFHSLFMEEEIPFALGVQMYKQKRGSSTT
jgi:hypothetical protein